MMIIYVLKLFVKEKVDFIVQIISQRYINTMKSKNLCSTTWQKAAISLNRFTLLVLQRFLKPFNFPAFLSSFQFSCISSSIPIFQYPFIPSNVLHFFQPSESLHPYTSLLIFLYSFLDPSLPALPPAVTCTFDNV